MRKLIALLALIPMLAGAQSYTNFPNLRSGNMDFTATIRANGSACASGTAIVSGGGSVTCVAVIPTSQKGANNGVATLDSGGKVPTAQLPFSGLTYDGSWNANTNSPSLADGSGTGGHFYIVSVAGSQNLGSGSISFAVGDWALYNGTIWQKVPSSAAVSSVFGRTGAVTATAGDYTATQVTNTPSGGIAATTAQAAINELDTEKQVAASTLTSWAALTRASGFDTFTQTPSSANLRGLLTDETGTGLAYFQGGALGTPSSGTLTSATGLPWSTGLTGVPTTAVGYGITGGAKLDAYAGGDTPSAFTLGIVDSADAATWRAAIGAGTATITPAALTKTDDTNVTLTLGGTPATSLLQAASITAGWTGNLSVARGGTGVGTLTGLALGNGTSAFSAYTGTSCTNQFPRILNASGAATCASVALASDVAGTLADGSLSGNVPLKNAANTFTAAQSISLTSTGTLLTLTNADATTDSIKFVNSGIRNWFMGPGTGTAVDDFALLYDGTRGATVMRASNAGNVTINAPGSGTALAVTGLTNAISWTGTGGFVNTLASDGSGGYLDAGGAQSFRIYRNSALSASFGPGLQLGSPTGGDKGAGTLNTAGAIYQNNVAVALSDGSNLTALPAISGANLTTLNASNISSGTLNNSRLPATINAATDVQVGGVSVCRSDGTNCPSGGLTLASGTWTPTVSSTANITGTPILQSAKYIQVGTIVTGSYVYAVDLAGAGAASFRVSLPVGVMPNNAGWNASGSCAVSTAVVAAVASGTTASMIVSWTAPGSSTSTIVNCTYTYTM